MEIKELRDRLLDVLGELETVETITVKYKRPYPPRWAIVKYDGLDYYVVEYLIYGKDLITGEVLKAWGPLPYISRNFMIIQEGFATEEEALAALLKYENH